MAERYVLQLQPDNFKRAIINGIKMHQKGLASFKDLVHKFNQLNKEM